MNNFDSIIQTKNLYTNENIDQNINKKINKMDNFSSQIEEFSPQIINEFIMKKNDESQTQKNFLINKEKAIEELTKEINNLENDITNKANSMENNIILIENKNKVNHQITEINADKSEYEKIKNTLRKMDKNNNNNKTLTKMLQNILQIKKPNIFINKILPRVIFLVILILLTINLLLLFSFIFDKKTNYDLFIVLPINVALLLFCIFIIFCKNINIKDNIIENNNIDNINDNNDVDNIKYSDGVNNTENNKSLEGLNNNNNTENAKYFEDFNKYIDGNKKSLYGINKSSEVINNEKEDKEENEENNTSASQNLLNKDYVNNKIIQEFDIKKKINQLWFIFDRNKNTIFLLLSLLQCFLIFLFFGFFMTTNYSENKFFILAFIYELDLLNQFNISLLFIFSFIIIIACFFIFLNNKKQIYTFLIFNSKQRENKIINLEKLIKNKNQSLTEKIKQIKDEIEMKYNTSLFNKSIQKDININDNIKDVNVNIKNILDDNIKNIGYNNQEKIFDLKNLFMVEIDKKMVHMYEETYNKLLNKLKDEMLSSYKTNEENLSLKILLYDLLLKTRKEQATFIYQLKNL